MTNRVTKEIAQKLKECGFEFKDNHIISGDIRKVPIYQYSCTSSEAIEWMDSKGVYVVPMRNVNTGRWIAEIQIDGQGGYFYYNMLVSHPARFDAYLAGIEAACDFLIKKEKTND